MIWRHDSEVYKPSSTSVQEHAKFHYKSQWAEHSLWKHLYEIPSLSQNFLQFPKDPTPSLVDFHWLSWIILLFSSPSRLSWLILQSKNPWKGTKLHTGKAGSSCTNFTTSGLWYGAASQWTQSPALGGDNPTLTSSKLHSFLIGEHVKLVIKQD